MSQGPAPATNCSERAVSSNHAGLALIPPHVTPRLSRNHLHLVGRQAGTYKMTMPSNRHSVLVTGAGRPVERSSNQKPRRRGNRLEGRGRRWSETGNEELCRARVTVPDPRVCVVPSLEAPAGACLVPAGAWRVRKQQVCAVRPHERAANRGLSNADQAAVHDSGKITLRENPVPPRHLRDQEPRRLGRVPAREFRRPRALEPGGRRHPGAEVLPQGRRAGAAEAHGGDPGSLLAVALRPPTSAASPSCPSRIASSARPTPARCSTASPAPGPTGAGRAAISPARTTRAPSSTSTATCWRCSSARRTPRSGSTPACTGPTASTARARATTTSTTRPAS